MGVTKLGTKSALTLLALALGASFAVAQEATGSFWRPVLDQIIPAFLAALVPVLGGVLTWAAAQGAAFLRKSAEAVENELLRGVLSNVAHQAGIAVQHMAQTFVDKLKAASTDGRLDPRDAREVLERAIAETWKGIGKQSRDVLTKEHGSVAEAQKVIEAAIEAKVHEAKVTTPVAEAPITDEERAQHELRLLRERLRSMPGLS